MFSPRSAASAVLLCLCAVALSGCHQVRVESSSGAQDGAGSTNVDLQVRFCAYEENGPTLAAQQAPGTAAEAPADPQPEGPQVQCADSASIDPTDGTETTRYVMALSLPNGVTAPDTFASTAGPAVTFARNDDYAARLQADRPIDDYTWHGWATDAQTAEDGFAAKIRVQVPADSSGQPSLTTLNWRTGGFVDYNGGAAAADLVSCTSPAVIPPGGALDNQELVARPVPGQPSSICVTSDFDTVYSTDLVRGDRCSNIDGQQDGAPSGYQRNEDGTCTPTPAPVQPAPPAAPTPQQPTAVSDPVDVCSNIAGIQGALAQGHVHDITGACVTAPSGCTIVGTAKADHIVGTKGDDVICGLGGADTISGRSGRDRIYGGSGSDRISGGTGSDAIYGGPGNDVISAGSGADRVDGGLGADRISGGSGADVIDGGAGADGIDGQGGDDVIRAGTGNDRAAGGLGDDSIDGGAGNDIVSGGGGDDAILGASGNDRVDGGYGADRVDGGAGRDTVLGGAGSDALLSGGDGNDRVYGGDGNDTIWGGAGADLLHGGTGDDTFYRSPDCDVWIGDSGRDVEIIIRAIALPGCYGGIV